MLQIIGWILCVYLIVKGCELLSMNTREGVGARAISILGAVVALLAAVGFFLLINEQVREQSQQQQQLQSSFSNLTP
jgi:hypothetical protein